MGTPRWQMREAEQQAMLEALFRAVADQMDDENEEWDSVIYDLACVLLRVIPFVGHISGILKRHPHQDDSLVGEAHGGIMAHRLFEFGTPREVRMRTSMAIATIARFSRTEAEAEMLAWTFFNKLCESIATRFTRNYSAETVHQPEKVFGGKAMDDVPPEEEAERLTAEEHAEEWVIKPPPTRSQE